MSASLSSIEAVGDVFSVTEANTEKSKWSDFRGAVGVKGRGMCGEKRQELVRPLSFPESGQGMRLFSHRRGNPETEASRNLNTDSSG